MKSSFYAMLSRMKYIPRWALMRNSRQENIEEHTAEVAILAHALAEITNAKFNGNVNVSDCVLRALYHDVPEIITGDMPTPVKYHDESIRDAYKNVERGAATRILSQLPEELRSVYEPYLLPEDETCIEAKLCKAADKFSALIKCIEEEKSGNVEFKNAKIATERSLHNMMLPAVEYFFEEFIPAYELTLDEQEQ